MPKPSKICASCGSEYESDALFCPKDGTPLGSSRTKPGEDPYLGLVLADQIELRQLIGIGSMGRVYRAFQRGVERDVAVKLLHRELSANSTLVARFLREARIASRLAHPNVVQVLMVGQLPMVPKDPSIGGELHIVMEFLDGISLLSALAASGGAMPLPRALHLVLQICDAVGEAHAQGIVHRDLKPENVMLVRRGNDPDFVKVLDFGIARLDWAEESISTQAGLIFGTARYISPEGSVGEPVGAPADVYAIATILYQCLSGQTPFDNDSPMALLVQHAHDAPPPINSIPRASYLPAPLAATIMRNLAKQPSQRAADARSFGRELVEAARASGLSPDDLVPRSTLLGQRSGHLSSFASVQRTKQMALSAEVASRIGAAVPSSRPSQVPLAACTPLPQSVSPERLEATAPISRVDLEPHTPQVPTVASRPSSPLVLQTTALAAPVYAPHENPPGSEKLSRRAGGTYRTLDDDDRPLPPLPKRGLQGRALALVVIGAVLAFVLLSAGAYRLGYFGHTTQTESAQSYVHRAQVAIELRQWDSPTRENVKDITDEGLARYPQDAALLEVRRRAADELVGIALERKFIGDLPAALRWATLAKQLVPTHASAQSLIDELQKQVQSAASGPDASAAPVRGKDAGAASTAGANKNRKSRAAGASSTPAASASESLPPEPEQPPVGPEEDSPPVPASTGGRWL